MKFKTKENKVVDIAMISDINLINAVGGQPPISKNALLINDDFSTNGKIEILSNTVSGTINLPPSLTHAIKWQYQYNSQNVVVILLELYPTFGRIWMNKWTTNTSWSGWKSITPG